MAQTDLPAAALRQEPPKVGGNENQKPEQRGQRLTRHDPGNDRVDRARKGETARVAAMPPLRRHQQAGAGDEYREIVAQRRGAEQRARQREMRDAPGPATAPARRRNSSTCANAKPRATTRYRRSRSNPSSAASPTPAAAPDGRAVRSRASAPSPSTTDSNRATNRPGPNASRHNATSQKYNGGCTSVPRRSRAIGPSPAWPA